MRTKIVTTAGRVFEVEHDDFAYKSGRKSCELYISEDRSDENVEHRGSVTQPVAKLIAEACGLVVLTAAELETIKQDRVDAAKGFFAEQRVKELEQEVADLLGEGEGEGEDCDCDECGDDFDFVPKYEQGDRVANDEGEEGVIDSVDDEDDTLPYFVQYDSGHSSWEAEDDLTLVDEEKGFAAPECEVGDRVIAKWGQVSGPGVVIRREDDLSLDNPNAMDYLVKFDSFEDKLWVHNQDIQLDLTPRHPEPEEVLESTSHVMFLGEAAGRQAVALERIASALEKLALTFTKI